MILQNVLQPVFTEPLMPNGQLWPDQAPAEALYNVDGEALKFVDGDYIETVD